MFSELSTTNNENIINIRRRLKQHMNNEIVPIEKIIKLILKKHIFKNMFLSLPHRLHKKHYFF